MTKVPPTKVPPTKVPPTKVPVTKVPPTKVAAAHFAAKEDSEQSSTAPLGRHSVLRTVVAEPVTSLLVQRALVMEVAHPKVASAVDDHSSFAVRPIARAWATADAAIRLVFGDADTALGAVHQIQTTHDRIKGRLGEEAANWAPDEPYSAHDQSLLGWVWATLIDTAEMARTRWAGGFDAAQAEAFYSDAVAMGSFLGIDRDVMPPDRAAFRSYLEKMLGGDVLGSTETSRRVARKVLWFSHWSVAPGLVRIERALAFATLDPRLVRNLGLDPSGFDVRLGGFLDGVLADWYRYLPSARRKVPDIYLLARRALDRIVR